MLRYFALMTAALIFLAQATSAYEVETVDLGRGAVDVYLPGDPTEGESFPIVMQLHGYGSSGAALEAYLRFIPLVDELRFIYVFPDGNPDSAGARFWNATDVCCDFDNTGIDDSAYLRQLLDEIISLYPIDLTRVMLIGHSNGGFMSYRMACDHAGIVTGVVSLAGTTFLDSESCQPAAPVHVLQVHGTADAGLLYEGGCNTGDDQDCYPSAFETVEQWAVFNSCPLQPDTSQPPLDISFLIPGAETSILRFRSGCRPGGSAELWSIENGGHAPFFNADFSRTIIDRFLSLTSPLARPRQPQTRVGSISHR